MHSSYKIENMVALPKGLFIVMTDESFLQTKCKRHPSKCHSKGFPLTGSQDADLNLITVQNAIIQKSMKSKILI